MFKKFMRDETGWNSPSMPSPPRSSHWPSSPLSPRSVATSATRSTTGDQDRHALTFRPNPDPVRNK